MKEGDKYLNKFYDVNNKYTSEYYYVSEKAREYKGFTIDPSCTDLVHIIDDGVCIHMRGSVREAKRVIDEIVKRKELGVYNADEFIV